VRKHFYEVLEAAAVHRITLSGLRHTMATLIFHPTKDIKLVAARLRHANEYLVLRRYGRLVAGADREAADQPRESLLEPVRRQARITQGSHTPQEDPDR
jgi:integrase